MSEPDRGIRRRDLLIQVAVALAVAAVTFGTAQLALFDGASTARSAASSAPPTGRSIPSTTPPATAAIGKTPAASPSLRELVRLDPSQESSLRSVSGDSDPLDLLIVNRGASTVRCYWLDHDGHRQDYGTLAPGEDMLLETYEGHPWVITTVQGQARFIVLPETGPSIVTIG